MLPVAAPAEVGVKMAEKDALLPALMVIGMLTPLMLNPVPEGDAAVTVNVAVPALVSVTICDPLVVNTVWFPKETLVPDSVATGALDTPSSKAPMSQAGP